MLITNPGSGGRKQLVVAAAAALAVMMSAPARAHHSANAQFDTQRVLTITGVLTKVENINPHSWWHVDVTMPDGTVQSWKLESLAPAGLIRRGLKVKTDLKAGATYTFRISPAWKDPDPSVKYGWMRSITANGTEYVVLEL